jgi:hypothetical protein
MHRGFDLQVFVRFNTRMNSQFCEVVVIASLRTFILLNASEIISKPSL